MPSRNKEPVGTALRRMCSRCMSLTTSRVKRCQKHAMCWWNLPALRAEKSKM
ncbi:Uncharacterised protein [Vibrio cholerae]|nr:Uncharacterised protein [Vibrio cholerae]CSD30927.1 Uncharacterised protein [Vibrio cholerae]